MSLEIKVEESKVVLEYFPEMGGPDAYVELLEEREYMKIYNTFSISRENVIRVEGDFVIISIGIVDGKYNRILADVLGTQRDYCFDNKIRLGKKDFVGVRKTSILYMLDKLISSENEAIYIDSIDEELNIDNHISYSEYRKFQKAIPHDAELTKYIQMRAATVFSGIFPNADHTIKEHDKWLEHIEKTIKKKIRIEDNVVKLDYLHALDYKKLIEIRSKLKYYIDNCDAYEEDVFQKAISEIVCFIFPKYLYAVREVQFKGFDAHDKRPDFVLIDYNGMIDFMEIKKPSVKLINVRTYRNNYSPSHELSGATQQVEKYIACIQRHAEEWESKTPLKIVKVIPEKMHLRVVNPQGLIIMGDASSFSQNQRKDFELIKRQYKHVTEIITYDDLLGRVDNMILALSSYASQSETGHNS